MTCQPDKQTTFSLSRINFRIFPKRFFSLFHCALPSSACSALRLTMACIITMLAVGAVFMNQAIFLEIAASFNLDTQDARFSFSLASLGYSLTFLFIGPLADTFDSRKITATGHAVLAVLLVCASWLHTYPYFLVCTGLVGMAAATIPAAMFLYVSRLAPTHKSGMYLGAIVASATLGIVIGRATLGASTSLLGWRAAYRLLSLTFATLALISFFVFESTTKSSKDQIPLKALYAEMIRMLLVPATRSLLLTGFFLFFGFLGNITFLTYHLASPPFSFTASQVGYISFAGLAAVIAPFSGGLSRRFGTDRILLPGLTSCLAALQVLYWSQTTVFMALGIVLLFLGVYACQPLLLLRISRRISPQAMGSASALYILACIGGGSLSSIVLGGIWTAYGWKGITVASSVSIALAMAILIASSLRDRERPYDAGERA